MRIELPSPSWADVHRAQDDAHTLTLPRQRPASLRQALLLPDGTGGETLRTRIVSTTPSELTFTL